MKKTWILVCCILIAAIIAVVVLVGGKNDAEQKYRQASEQVTRLQAEADAAAQAASEQLTRAQTDAQAAQEQLRLDLDHAQAEAEQALAQARAEGEEALQQVREEAQIALMQAQAEADEAAQALSQARTESEAALRQAQEQAEAEVSRVRTESEEALQQVREETQAALTQAQAEAEKAAAALQDAQQEAATATAAAMRAGAPYAYLLYANGDWRTSYWGTDAEGMTCKPAALLDQGMYTVRLTLDAPADGLSFLSLCVKDGEKAYPGAAIRINAIRVNGEEIPFTKGYTASDDHVDFRVNLYNTAGSTTPPAGARSFDGSLEGASSTMVDRAAFAAMQSLEVEFELIPNL